MASTIFSKDEYIVFTNCLRHMLRTFHTSEQPLSKVELKQFIHNRCGLFASEDTTSYSKLEQLLEKEMDFVLQESTKKQKTPEDLALESVSDFAEKTSNLKYPVQYWVHDYLPNCMSNIEFESEYSHMNKKQLLQRICKWVQKWEVEPFPIGYLLDMKKMYLIFLCSWLETAEDLEKNINRTLCTQEIMRESALKMFIQSFLSEAPATPNNRIEDLSMELVGVTYCIQKLFGGCDEDTFQDAPLHIIKVLLDNPFAHNVASFVLDHPHIYEDLICEEKV